MKERTLSQADVYKKMHNYNAIKFAENNLNKKYLTCHYY